MSVTVEWLKYPASTPRESGCYWVTRKDGSVERSWYYYFGPNMHWDEVIAFIPYPDQRPEAYKDHAS